MSVLIKGMELPKNCEVCPLNFYECALLEKSSEEIMQYFGGDSRHPDCPLVEVPKHGRLIDADMLKRNITANLPIAVQDLCPSFCNIVDMQKTVIDESGEE